MEAYAGSSENIEQISEELLAHRCGISDAILEGSGVLLDSVVVVLLVPYPAPKVFSETAQVYNRDN